MAKYFLIIHFFICSSIHCQTYNISGVISDSSSGDFLISGNLFIQELQKGTISNSYGYYSISIPKNQYSIIFSYVGYCIKEVIIDLTNDTILNISLVPESEKIDEVVVVSKSSRQQMLDSRMGMVYLPIKKIETIPMILGENDVIKTLQTLPGVQSGTEGSSGLYVRGGGPDQNQILLDGIPVYYINHLYGFLSVFNNDAIKSVSISKGSFPAQYGGRLSSVIDINMKEGNINKLAGKGSIGLVASKLLLEGPLFKKQEKTSFMISGRRTYLDAFTIPLQKLKYKNVDDMKLEGYNFYDLNTKINHKFSSNDQIFLSGYFGKDNYYSYSDWTTDKLNSNDKSDLAWGNNSISLRWNHIFKNSMFVNTTLAVTNYNYFLSSKSTNYDLEQVVESRRDIFKYTSGIRDYVFKSDLNYYLALSHNVKFGINITQHKFKPGNIFEENYIRVPDTNVIHKNGTNYELTANQDIIYPIQSHLYIQDDFSVSSNFKINYGLHTSIYYLNKLDKYLFYEPRLSIRYLFNNKLAFKSSYAKVSQFMFLLSNNSVGMPTDLWVSAYKNIKPQESQQISLGFDYAPSNKYFLSLESYFKPMNNLAEYKEGTGLTECVNWYDKITQGKGTAYGIEFFAEKKQGKLSGWLGYTLAWSSRQFKELNNGASFHSKYDRRHDISIVANYKKSKKLSLTLLWVYGSGAYTTLYTHKAVPLNLFEADRDFGLETGYNYASERNNVHLPSYHRMDFGSNFTKKKKHGLRIFSVGVYNMYNRRNPYYLTYTEKDSGLKAQLVSLLPILPYFNYKFEF